MKWVRQGEESVVSHGTVASSGQSFGGILVFLDSAEHQNNTFALFIILYREDLLGFCGVNLVTHLLLH